MVRLTTRRRVLSGIGSGLLVSLAGCGEPGGVEGDEVGDEEDDEEGGFGGEEDDDVRFGGDARRPPAP